MVLESQQVAVQVAQPQLEQLLPFLVVAVLSQVAVEQQERLVLVQAVQVELVIYMLAVLQLVEQELLLAGVGVVLDIRARVTQMVLQQERLLAF